MALTKLKKVSKKKQLLRKQKKSCRKRCKSKLDCIKQKCAKVDNELWKLNWTYNNVLRELVRDIFS